MCAEWMSANSCYDLIPPSSKIVVFDTRLRVRFPSFVAYLIGVHMMGFRVCVCVCAGQEGFLCPRDKRNSCGTTVGPRYTGISW